MVVFRTLELCLRFQEERPQARWCMIEDYGQTSYISLDVQQTETIIDLYTVF